MLAVNIFVLILSTYLSHSSVDTATLLKEVEDGVSDHEIVIDQRQNGTQNFRIKISGLSIAIPDDRDDQKHQSEQPSLEQFASLFVPSSSQTNLNHPQNDNVGDFSDIAAFFDWKKSEKSGNKKSSEDTQSRTKDIPTEVQQTEDSKMKIQQMMQRKYKLLVGEKYIIPILRFLKKQTETVDE